MRKMTYVFINTNEILDLPKPISTKVQYIGGIALTKPTPLEKVSFLAFKKKTLCHKLAFCSFTYFHFIGI